MDSTLVNRPGETFSRSALVPVFFLSIGPGFGEMEKEPLFPPMRREQGSSQKNQATGKSMNYLYEQLAQKNDQELFDFQLQFPPNDRNFILAGLILDERSRKELKSIETRSMVIAIVALVIVFLSFALSVL